MLRKLTASSFWNKPVERAGYVNNWWAYRSRRKGGTETEITLVGERKLVEFYGTLTPDVETRKLYWHGAQNSGQGISVAEREARAPTGDREPLGVEQLAMTAQEIPKREPATILADILSAALEMGNEPSCTILDRFVIHPVHLWGITWNG